MAKVFSGVSGIEPPNYDYSTNDWAAEQKKDDEYIAKIVEYAKKNGKGTLKGERLNFPHADGHAQYVVLESTKLIHLAIGDAWHAPIANYITAKGIRDEVERTKRWKAMFAGAGK